MTTGTLYVLDCRRRLLFSLRLKLHFQMLVYVLSLDLLGLERLYELLQVLFLLTNLHLEVSLARVVQPSFV